MISLHGQKLEMILLQQPKLSISSKGRIVAVKCCHNLRTCCLKHSGAIFSDVIDSNIGRPCKHTGASLHKLKIPQLDVHQVLDYSWHHSQAALPSQLENTGDLVSLIWRPPGRGRLNLTMKVPCQLLFPSPSGCNVEADLNAHLQGLIAPQYLSCQGFDCPHPV